MTSRVSVAVGVRPLRPGRRAINRDLRIDAGIKRSMIFKGTERVKYAVPGIDPSTTHVKESTMKSVAMNLLCRFLVLAMLSLSFQTASAAIIGTDQAAVVAAAQSDRSVIIAALSRSDIAGQLQAQGVDPSVAQQRVAAMTDQEAHTLANSIASAPAGANVGWAAVVVAGLLVWYFMYRK